MIVSGGTHREAWTKAGLKGNFSPSQFKKKFLDVPKVAAAIRQRRAEIAERNRVTEDEIIRGLREVRDRALSEGDYSPAVRALELLGKYLSMFDRDRKPPSTNVFINNRSDSVPSSDSPASSHEEAATDRLAKIASLGSA